MSGCRPTFRSYAMATELHAELNRAAFLCNNENRNLCSAYRTGARRTLRGIGQ